MVNKNLLHKAEKLRQLGDYCGAVKLYKGFLSASKSATTHQNKSNKCSGRTSVRGEQMFGALLSDKLDAMLAIADLFRVLGRFSDSRKFYNKTAGFLKNKNDDNVDRYFLDCLIGDALCDKCEGKYKLALSKLNKTIKLAKNQKDADALGFIHWHIGMIYRFLGALNKSKKHLEISLATHKKINDLNGVGFSLCGLGGLLRASGRLEDSLKLYTRANKIFKKNRDAYGRAYSFCGMANAYKASDKIKKAISYYGFSEPLYIKTKDLSSLAFVYKGLAGCYLKTGCKILSDFYFAKSLKFFKKSQDTRGLLSLYLERLSRKNDGELYKKAKMLAEANNLKNEIGYLRKYNKDNPQKWLG